LDANVIFLRDREGLVALSKAWGLRPDWHEPDEQGVSVEIHDGTFDNAHEDESEAFVIIKRSAPGYERSVGYEDKVAVNLATLLSWAAQG
jgi:hypothetical protein